MNILSIYTALALMVSLATTIIVILPSQWQIYTLHFNGRLKSQYINHIQTQEITTVNDTSIVVTTSSGNGSVEKKSKFRRREQKQLDSTEIPLCQRQCSHRKNKISYIGGTAGLGDRTSIIHGLAQIAGYLCAELVLPPPSFLLGTGHNHGVPVSNNIAWSDLYNITFLDGSPVIRSVDIRSTTNHSAQQKTDCYHLWSDFPVFSTSGTNNCQGWHHIVSTDGKMKEDFRTIQKFAFEKETKTETSKTLNNSNTIGFIWEIHQNWYDSDLWEDELPNVFEEYNHYDIMPYLNRFYLKHPYIEKSKRKGCLYTDDSNTTPLHIKAMQRRLVRQITRHSVNNTKYGILHLRRGDSVGECDTSVDQMREFFACSLNGTDSLGHHLTILLTSDEEDAEYRRDIIKLADEYPHVLILDADKLVTKLVSETVKNGIIEKGLDNNYYIYAVEDIIRNFNSNFVKYRLIRRKKTCRKCVNLKKKLNALSDN